jgi:hypothetical protein
MADSIMVWAREDGIFPSRHRVTRREAGRVVIGCKEVALADLERAVDRAVANPLSPLPVRALAALRPMAPARESEWYRLGEFSVRARRTILGRIVLDFKERYSTFTHAIGLRRVRRIYRWAAS